MNAPSKVLWAEGLTLRPQQFQQQDRYHEARLQRMASAMHPYLWGVRSIEWNVDSLTTNSLRAISMSLIFQDGEIYDAPGADALPPAVDLSKLPLTEESFTFYAALPFFKGHGGNLYGSGDAKDGSRFHQADHDTPDLYTEAVSADIAYLSKRADLLLHTAPRNAHVNFPVVRILRVASGGFQIDPSFMPPSLAIGASDLLPRSLDNLMQKLKAKTDALSADQREPSKNVVVVQSGDVSSFWLLHTINTGAAALTHYFHSQSLHPERLYLELLSLAGGLMTFSKKYTLTDLPAYNHAEPAPCFADIDVIIRDLVDTVISAKYNAIKLTQDANKRTHYHAQLSAAIDQDTILCLAVKADMPALELVAAVPLRFKLGAPDDVNRAILSALPGVELVHMPQVPAGVPVRPNTYYFALQSKGQRYDSMLQAQAVTIYVPAGLDGLQLDMFAVIP